MTSLLICKLFVNWRCTASDTRTRETMIYLFLGVPSTPCFRGPLYPLSSCKALHALAQYSRKRLRFPGTFVPHRQTRSRKDPTDSLEKPSQIPNLKARVDKQLFRHISGQCIRYSVPSEFINNLRVLTQNSSISPYVATSRSNKVSERN